MESFSFNQKRKLQKYQVDLKKDNMGFQNLLSMLNGHSWFGSIPLNFQLEIVFEHGIDNCPAIQCKFVHKCGLNRL